MSTSPKTASGCQPCGYSISGLVAMTPITSHPSLAIRWQRNPPRDRDNERVIECMIERVNE